MPYSFRVRSHPLGVVVFRTPDTIGELVLPGEDCCGVAFEELTRIARTGGEVVVDGTASGCRPLRRETM